jgi:hypothetical protein
MVDDLYHVFPVYYFVGVIQVHQVVFLSLHNKLQLRLHELVLADMLEDIALILLTSPPPVLVSAPLCAVLVRGGPFLFLVLETEQVVG